MSWSLVLICSSNYFSGTLVLNYHYNTCTHIITKLCMLLQGRKMLCESGGGSSGFRHKSQHSHLRGSGGILPQENLEFSTLRVFLRPSDSSFGASFYCVIRYTEKYTHLKSEGAQAPSAPPPPPFLHLCIMCTWVNLQCVLWALILCIINFNDMWLVTL